MVAGMLTELGTCNYDEDEHEATGEGEGDDEDGECGANQLAIVKVCATAKEKTFILYYSDFWLKNNIK